jgi:hypothetical protein
MHTVAAAVTQVVPLGLKNFLTTATCLVSLFFGISYTVMRRWWRYQMGWNLFVLRVAIGFILLPFTLHLMFGISYTSVFYQWFTIIVFILVPLALVHITWLLYEPVVHGVMKRLGLADDEPRSHSEESDFKQPPSTTPAP